MVDAPPQAAPPSRRAPGTPPPTLRRWGVVASGPCLALCGGGEFGPDRLDRQFPASRLARLPLPGEVPAGLGEHHLGSAVHVATHMKLDEESRIVLEGLRPEGELKIRLEPGPQSTGLIAYTKWLTDQQLNELRKRLPGVEF